jgi:hypothetical protein
VVKKESFNHERRKEERKKRRKRNLNLWALVGKKPREAVGLAGAVGLIWAIPRT